RTLVVQRATDVFVLMVSAAGQEDTTPVNEAFVTAASAALDAPARRLTPAVQHALTHDATMGICTVHEDLMAALSASVMRDAFQAIAVATPDKRLEFLARGLSTYLTLDLWFGTEVAEIEDTSIALYTQPGRVRAVHSLTETGAALRSE